MIFEGECVSKGNFRLSQKTLVRYLYLNQNLVVNHLRVTLEVFLSQVQNELFKLPQADIKYSNLSREEWNAIRSLADDRNIIIKKADKGSYIVI